MRALIYPMLGWLVVLAAAFTILWLVNLPRRHRHRQVGWPVFALLYAFAVAYVYHDDVRPVLDWIDALLGQVSAYLGQWIATDLTRWIQPLVALNALLLICFLAFKSIVNGALSLVLAVLRFLRWIRLRFELGERREEAPPSVSRLSFAYETIPGEGIVLRRRWIYFRNALLGLGLLALAALAVVTCSLILKTDYPLPALPALSVVILFEAAWYLGGPRRTGEEGGVSGDDVRPGIAGDYRGLWEGYQRIWPDRVLAAGVVEADAFENEQNAEKIAGLGAFLDAGENILATCNEHILLLPAISRRAWHTVAEGGRVVVLAESEDTVRALSGALGEAEFKAAGAFALRGIRDYDAFLGDRDGTEVLVVTPATLLHRSAFAEPWFADVRLVIVTGLEAVFAALPIVAMVVHQLQNRAGSRLQHVFVGHDRRAPQPALQRSLPVRAREIALAPASANRVHAILWGAEGLEWFQRKLLTAGVDKHLGTEAILAVPAWKGGVGTIWLCDAGGVAWREHREELEQHLHLLKPEWRPELRRVGSAHEKIVRGEGVLLELPVRKGCLIVRDRRANLSSALAERKGRASEEVLIHIVSPPYLLRDYLAANIGYFSKAPLRALSARLGKGATSQALDLWARLGTGGLEEAVLLNELRAFDPSIDDAEKGVQALFMATFGLDIVRDKLLTVSVRREFVPAADCFGEVVRFSIPLTSVVAGALGALGTWEVVDSEGATLGIAAADRVRQAYLPGQVHAFDGKPYEVASFDAMNRRLTMKSCSPAGEIVYRPAMRVVLREVAPLAAPDAEDAIDRAGWRVVLQLLAADFDVHTTGYFIFRK